MRQSTNGVIAEEQRSDSLKLSKAGITDNSNAITTKGLKKTTIRDYCSNDPFILWAPKHADTTNYKCEISLHENTALYWYHGQCTYDYLTNLTSDSTIEVLWSYRSDCILNMDFLEKSNGISKSPNCGDTFATLTLINDTTLKVNYNFPEWTKRVNAIAKDSLFPIFYYLKQGDCALRNVVYI